MKIILKQVPLGPTITEYLYFGLGSAIVVLTGHSWLAERVLAQ